MREELPANRRREVAVDRKIVPFEHVTDHARGDHSTCLRGIHLTPTRRDFASINIALAECTKRSAEKSNHRHCRLRERPHRRRAAEQRDELAPPHSITSSAATSSLSGTLSPR